MADIIKHNEFKDTYDDPGHPIPSIGYIDVNGIKKSGGADLVIVISKPLQSDEYSLNRLLSKIEGYLGYILSEEFKREAGEPSQENTNIIVNIHPDSCNEAFLLLEKSVGWVNENNSSLKVKRLSVD